MFMKTLAFILALPERVARANDNAALITEAWSREALLTLSSNMVMASLVHRDFDPLVASQGDIVNTSRPADFSGIRKTDADSVTTQDAVSPNIAVPLDQHFHVTYVIKDGEWSKAHSDLVVRYMEPAARELAEKVDQLLAGQVGRLLTNQVGEADSVTALNVDDYILDADEKLNDNRAPKFGRRLVMSSRFNRAALGADIVVSAEKRGDEGTALREASVGRIYGFDSFMDQNVNYVDQADAEVADAGTATVTDAAEPKGETVIPTTITTTETLTTGGEYVTIAGSAFLHRTASTADDTGDADLTLTEGVTGDVASGAAVVLYKACLVKDGFAAGYVGDVIVDGFAANKGPQVGQLISFAKTTSTHTYTVIGVTETTTTEFALKLDRPLDATLANNAEAYPGPSGSRNLAFTRDAIALVSRPLATVDPGAGASSSVANFDGLSMRVTVQYDSTVQGHRVTFDLLCGVAILDERLACVVNG